MLRKDKSVTKISISAVQKDKSNLPSLKAYYTIRLDPTVDFICSKIRFIAWSAGHPRVSPQSDWTQSA